MREVSFDRSDFTVILREDGKLGSNHIANFSKATMRHAKIREKKGPSQGIIQKCEPQERVPWVPTFEERTQNETLRQERCVRELKKESQDTFYSPAEAWVMPAPSSMKPEERQFVIDS